MLFRSYQELKATVKGFKNQIAAVTKSRERWRLEAEAARKQVLALEAEIRELRAQSEAAQKKITRGMAC